MNPLTRDSRTLSCSPQLMPSPSMAHVNAACRKDFVSFVRKGLSCVGPQRQLLYELAYMRNRALS